MPKSSCWFDFILQSQQRWSWRCLKVIFHCWERNVSVALFSWVRDVKKKKHFSHLSTGEYGSRHIFTWGWNITLKVVCCSLVLKWVITNNSDGMLSKQSGEYFFTVFTLTSHLDPKAPFYLSSIWVKLFIFYPEPGEGIKHIFFSLWGVYGKLFRAVLLIKSFMIVGC